MEPFASPTEYLLAELNRLDLILHRQIHRLRAAHLLIDDPYRGLCIPDSHVDAILLARPSDGLKAPAASALTAAIARATEDIRQRTHASNDPLSDPPLCALAKNLRLAAFEKDTLLLALATEIDSKYETLIAYVQNDIARKRPTLDLALKLFSDDFHAQLAHRKFFAADSALLFENLLTLGGADDLPYLSHPLIIDQRVVDHILGCDRIDSRLATVARLQDGGLPLEDLTIPPALRSSLQKLAFGSSCKTTLLIGKRGCGKHSVARALCAGWKCPMLTIDTRQLIADSVRSVQTLALLRREAILRSAGLFFDRFDLMLSADHATLLPAFRRALSNLAVPIFFAGEHPFRLGPEWRPYLAFEFPPSKSTERADLWRHAAAQRFNGQSEALDLISLADQFVLTPGEIEESVEAAHNRAMARDPDKITIEDCDLRAAAADISTEPLRRVARKVEPSFSWEDLVLPEPQLRQLRNVSVAVTRRALIYERWGFDRKLPLGKGLNALFAGPSGAGKTMAAQVIARDLALDLYQIDLSSVVSKYIGETEKNLGAIFAAAQNCNAILFFDEADALFGKRSEVKDALDRYANIEVAYLLQKIEEYDGIVILATNLGKNIDDAFRRRIRHIIEFPFPDAQHREKIWRRAFPLEAPLADDINFTFLAEQFELAGGNIRNIALTSAFRAADETPENAGPQITMRNLIHATAHELRKAGKLPTKSEFREYYESVTAG